MATTTPTFFGSVLTVIACTPNRNFDETAYEKGVIEPARRIRSIALRSGDAPPSEDQVREVMSLLVLILETKMVDVDERTDRIKGILDLHGLHPLSDLAAGLLDAESESGAMPRNRFSLRAKATAR